MRNGIVRRHTHTQKNPIRVEMYPSFPNGVGVKRFHGTGGSAVLNIVKGRCPDAMGYSCNHDLHPVFAAGERELATNFGQKFPVCCLAHYDTAVGYTCMHVPSELG